MYNPYASEYLLALNGKEKPSEASEDRLKNIYSRRKEGADNNWGFDLSDLEVHLLVNKTQGNCGQTTMCRILPTADV